MSHSPPIDEDASISIPSIAFVAVLGFLIYRYFFSSSTSNSSSTSSQRGSSNNASRAGGGGTLYRFTPQQVDQVAEMFPQLNRRDIMWDLQRNRGSVAATTERIMTGGRLEPAPPSFQPSFPSQSSTTGNTPSTLTSTSSTYPSRTTEPDLITRYNLQSRVGASDKGKERERDTAPTHGWASSKDERAAMLKRRRDEMILAARRKMQERDANSSGGGDGSAAITAAPVELVGGRS